MKRIALALVALISMAGCTTMSNVGLANASPEKLKRAYKDDLCIARASMLSTVEIEAEVERRGLDCGPIVDRYRARRAAATEAAANHFIAIGQQQPPAPIQAPAPRITSCNALPGTNNVTCTTY